MTPPAAPPSGALHLDAPNGDVLIVDDFVDTLTLYDALLTEDGHRVRTATTGALALQMVEEREPELVLLDVSMPGMDGLEVLRRWRESEGRVAEALAGLGDELAAARDAYGEVKKLDETLFEKDYESL